MFFCRHCEVREGRGNLGSILNILAFDVMARANPNRGVLARGHLSFKATKYIKPSEIPTAQIAPIGAGPRNDDNNFFRNS